MVLTRHASLRWLAVVLLVALMPAAAGAQERRVDLRPKFVTGQQMRFKMEVGNTSTPMTGKATGPRPKVDPTSPRPEPPAATKSQIEMGLVMKVREGNPSDGATVDLTFESLKVSTSGPEGKIEYDSAKPSKEDGDVMGVLMGGLVGQTLTLKVDPSGNITSITGGEGFGALAQFMGGGGGASGMFGPLFNIRKGSGQASVGESWENEDVVDTSLMGRFKMVTRHTLRSAVGTDAKVDVTGRISPDSEAASAGGAKIKRSNYTGAYTWDTAAGMLKQMNTSMAVEMETNVDGKPSTTRNESTMKVTRVR